MKSAYLGYDVRGQLTNTIANGNKDLNQHQLQYAIVGSKGFKQSLDTVGNVDKDFLKCHKQEH